MTSRGGKVGFLKYVAPGRTTGTEWVVLHPGIRRQHKLKLREG